jgi:hypothetical protein
MQLVAAQRTVFAAALLSACARRGGQAPSGPPAVVRLAVDPFVDDGASLRVASATGWRLAYSQRFAVDARWFSIDSLAARGRDDAALIVGRDHAPWLLRRAEGRWRWQRAIRGDLAFSEDRLLLRPLRQVAIGAHDAQTGTFSAAPAALASAALAWSEWRSPSREGRLTRGRFSLGALASEGGARARGALWIERVQDDGRASRSLLCGGEETRSGAATTRIECASADAAGAGDAVFALVRHSAIESRVECLGDCAAWPRQVGPLPGIRRMQWGPRESSRRTRAALFEIDERRARMLLEFDADEFEANPSGPSVDPSISDRSTTDAGDLSLRRVRCSAMRDGRARLALDRAGDLHIASVDCAGSALRYSILTRVNGASMRTDAATVETVVRPSRVVVARGLWALASAGWDVEGRVAPDGAIVTGERAQLRREFSGATRFRGRMRFEAPCGFGGVAVQAMDALSREPVATISLGLRERSLYVLLGGGDAVTLRAFDATREHELVAGVHERALRVWLDGEEIAQVAVDPSVSVVVDAGPARAEVLDAAHRVDPAPLRCPTTPRTGLRWSELELIAP